MDWDLVYMHGTSRSKKEQVLNFSDVTKSRKYIFLPVLRIRIRDPVPF
jgi:hypothetical protein